MKLKCNHWGEEGDLMQYDWFPYNKRIFGQHGKPCEDNAICKPRGEASKETTPADTSSLDF